MRYKGTLRMTSLPSAAFITSRLTWREFEPSWRMGEEAETMAQRREPADDEINVSAIAFCAPQPRGPIRQRQPGAVAGDLLGHIGLDLMPARLAPDD
jgi:hypothetical protein